MWKRSSRLAGAMLWCAVTVLVLLVPLIAQDASSQGTPKASEVLAKLPGPAKPAAIDLFLLEQMRTAKIPGLAAAIVKQGKVAWVGAYGWADIAKRTRVDRHTLFQTASVSKTVTAVAIMQLVEKGSLKLDADINTALPFAVRHPRHPKVPITLRHLLTHTSGIRDNWDLLEGTWVKNGDFKKTLAQSLNAYFTEDGEYFNGRKNFYRWAPGSKHDYSNVGIALAAFAAQHVSGVSFERLCERQIFKPLGLKGPAYRLRGISKDTLVAMPYGLKRRADRFEPLGHHGYLDFPSGTLRISTPHLARFLLSFIGDGQVDGVRLLKAATVRVMRRISFSKIAPKQGLVWFFDEIGDDQVMGHDGSDPGVASFMYYRPKDGIGFIVLMNGEPRKRRFETEVGRRLLLYASKL